MGQNSKELTHDEVWDDSALIESWNEALDEYKKYHSIHAKGGRLEDLDDEELDQLQSQTFEKPTALNGDQTPTAAVSRPQISPEIAGTSQDARPSDSAAKASISDQRKDEAGPAVAAPPQALLGAMQDEGLKRLLMSWYYAGYYTGLYEGQQQRQAQQGGQAPS